jgi:glucokinase
MSRLYCGVDIGGTKCSAALIDEQGTLVDRIRSHEHTGSSEAELVTLVAGIVRELLQRNGVQESDLPAIGIAFAGHIRYRDGVVITTSNLPGFRDYPLRDAFQKHFSVPVLLDNDANAQAWGEHCFGAGRGYEDMIFLTISTGIGAGIILNGTLYRGITGTAGEFGHTIVAPDSELVCTCGNHGCLMAVASGLALPHLLAKKMKEGRESRITRLPSYDPQKINGEILKEGLDMDDDVAREIILECGYYLGIGIYNIFQTFNPPLIVLGGGLTRWGDPYLDKIRSTFRELARNMIYDPVKITRSEILGDAGVIGAAALTMQKTIQ